MPYKAASDDVRCIADNKTGARCQGQAQPGRDVCEAHDPDNPRGGWHPPPDERRCTATATGGADRPERNGERCNRWARPGMTVCRAHGGASPQAMRKAAERLMTERARRMVATYGLKIETTPEAAILDEVQWTAGHVAWLRERVQETETAPAAFDPDDPDAAAALRDSLIWGVTRRKTGGDDHGVTEEAAPHIWLRLYQQERAHLVKVSAEAIRIGIQDRQVKLAEQQGALVARVLHAILDGLELTAAQKALALKVVPEQLRALQTTALTN